METKSPRRPRQRRGKALETLWSARQSTAGNKETLKPAEESPSQEQKRQATSRKTKAREKSQGRES